MIGSQLISTLHTDHHRTSTTRTAKDTLKIMASFEENKRTGWRRVHPDNGRFWTEVQRHLPAKREKTFHCWGRENHRRMYQLWTGHFDQLLKWDAISLVFIVEILDQFHHHFGIGFRFEFVSFVGLNRRDEISNSNLLWYLPDIV